MRSMISCPNRSGSSHRASGQMRASGYSSRRTRRCKRSSSPFDPGLLRSDYRRRVSPLRSTMCMATSSIMLTCHEIGLTATPVDFVTKSTFRLFDCEGQLPTRELRPSSQAVQDRYLNPVRGLRTRHSSCAKGSGSKRLTKEQIGNSKKQGERPGAVSISLTKADQTRSSTIRTPIAQFCAI